MDEVDTSIASQNTIVAAIGTKLKTLRTRIAASKKNGEETMSSIPPIVKRINDKLDIIKNLVANAKTIKMQYDATNTKVQSLGKEKEVVSKDLAAKNRQIADLTEQLKNNQSTAVDNHTKLTAQIEALNQANRESVAAKETVEANLVALQQQSATATQQQRDALLAAQQAQGVAEQAVAATKTELENSMRHADAMQSHMNKLGELKKHQTSLTELLKNLDQEISSANNEMNELDGVHVKQLGYIKEELEKVDVELNKIIVDNPGSGDGGVGSSTTTSPFHQNQSNFNSPPAAGGDPARQQRTSAKAQPPPSWADRLSQSGKGKDEFDIDIYPLHPGEEGADAIYGTHSDARYSGHGKTSSDAKKSNMTSIIGDDDSSNPLSKFSRNTNMGKQPPSAAQVQATEQQRLKGNLFGKKNQNMVFHSDHSDPSHQRTTDSYQRTTDSYQRPTDQRPTEKKPDRRDPFKIGGTRKKQRGGYIAVKKTHSKSYSSSGRRGSSSSSKSTRRRHRRRGSSSSSTRSSRR